jgi:hypothetical protein
MGHPLFVFDLGSDIDDEDEGGTIEDDVLCDDGTGVAD